jgi:hypothetical protein
VEDEKKSSGTTLPVLAQNVNETGLLRWYNDKNDVKTKRITK